MMHRFAAPFAAALVAAAMPLGAAVGPSAQPPTGESETTEGAGEVSRPASPWVFRSVLDKRPRMVTVALSDGLWLAYDAAHCGLYKAWAGDVKFDGAVYTGRHGPQPESEGNAYQEIDGGDFWTLLDADGSVTGAAPRFRGYRVDGTRSVMLMYAFPTPDDDPDAATPRMNETPEAMPGSGDVDATVLRRTFQVTDLPPGRKLRLLLGTDTQGGRFSVTTGQAKIVTEERGGGTVAFLEFTGNGTSTLVTAWTPQSE